MIAFDSYFTNEEIIKLLCRFRIKYAKRRHKLHMKRDISLHEATLSKIKNPASYCPKELSDMLPPRRQWIRLKLEERKTFNSSDKLATEELRRTILSIHIKVKRGMMTPPVWYNNLLGFLNDVRQRISFLDANVIKKPTIIPVRKENKIKCRKFRPISQYSLIDRVIIGQTAKYLTKLFDDQLEDCSLAFRAKKIGQSEINHHDAIAKIIEFKKKHLYSDIFVAECDIKKFFDCVDHKRIKKIFSQFVKIAIKKHGGFDFRAAGIFRQYLKSYAFNKNVYTLNNTPYFDRPGYEGGEFEWPLELLKSEIWGEALNKRRIGVPQGGALSCLIANLVLHDVDTAVMKFKTNSDILFLRFCDDMILLTTSKSLCQNGLDTYVAQTKKKGLLIHEPKEIDKYGKPFYNSTKSKMPFLWKQGFDNSQSAPWISFVGYQVRYDGMIRVRKKSLNKEMRKQEQEMNAILRAINIKEPGLLNENSRKSCLQQIAAYESRLIAMSVGKYSLKDYKKSKPALCWTNGFKMLNFNQSSITQLRYLDSKRSRYIHILKRKLNLLKKKTDKPDTDIFPNKYNGAPFSYYGFLHRNKSVG